MGGRGTFRQGIGNIRAGRFAVGGGGGSAGADEFREARGSNQKDSYRTFVDANRFTDKVVVRKGKGVEKELKAIFPKARPTNRQLARLVGAPDGSRVAITALRGIGGGIRIVTTNPNFVGSQIRTVSIGANGAVVMNNGRFELASNAPNSLGLNILARQVSGANALGVNTIRAEAPRGLGTMAYNNLALVGFNAPVNYSASPALRAVNVGNTGGGKPTAISSFIETPAGRTAWRTNGHSFTGEFNTQDGSVSRLVLDALMRSKRTS